MNKIKCKICGKEYVQVCSHVIQAHKELFSTAREYKEYYGYDLIKGLVPKEYKEMKAQQCKENGTMLTGKQGVKSRFKKGDKGIGVYKRSKQTLKRLGNLHKLK